MRSQPLALRGGTIYPYAGSVPVRATLLVAGGRIQATGREGDVAIPDDAEIVDCSGCTIAAGFWNCHVHFFERKWANAEAIPADELEAQLTEFTRYGFTTVFDLSSLRTNTQTIRRRIGSGEVRGPRILSAGEGLIPRNGLPPETVLRVLGSMPTPMPEIDDENGAANAAAQLLESGVDAVKLFASSQSGSALSVETMRAAVERAHAVSKPAFAHVNTNDDILRAGEAGVDVIAHTTPASGNWDDALLQRMQTAGVALTPTLGLWRFFMRHDRYSTRQRFVETAVAQLRGWHERGGTVLFGTDYGAVDADPTAEYELMSAAGMDAGALLASLTTSPARQFGESTTRGGIEPGYAADLVVLKGDPSMKLSQLTEVRYTVRDGEIVHRG